MRRRSTSTATSACVGSLHKVGSIKARQGRFDSAVDYYQRALEIEPENPIFMNDLGTAMTAPEKIRDPSGDISTGKGDPDPERH